MTFPESAVPLLLEWYREHHRDLPWRRTQDPYRIWLSEIMLQQTRVEAVKPYYERFLTACPTVGALAVLPEEKLFKLWEGLGYYSRARNLQKAAKEIVATYGGVFPTRYEEILRLPGIGEYTAGTIASIAFGARIPAVDGNVLRVLSRLLASEADISLADTKKAVRDALLPIVPQDAGAFNQSLIELGATVCVPNGEPNCALCPLAPLCLALAQGRTSDLPVKSPKKPRRVEEKTVLILSDGRRTLLSKRPDTGLLAGLFELPNFDGHLTKTELESALLAHGFSPLSIERLPDAKHIFTHVEWRMIAYAVRVAEGAELPPAHGTLFFAENEELAERYAIPSAFSAYKERLTKETFQ